MSLSDYISHVIGTHNLIIQQFSVHSEIAQWRTQEFFWGGVSTNSVEDRENGDLGVVAP